MGREIKSLSEKKPLNMQLHPQSTPDSRIGKQVDETKTEDEHVMQHFF